MPMIHLKFCMYVDLIVCSYVIHNKKWKNTMSILHTNPILTYRRGLQGVHGKWNRKASLFWCKIFEIPACFYFKSLEIIFYGGKAHERHNMAVTSNTGPGTCEAFKIVNGQVVNPSEWNTELGSAGGQGSHAEWKMPPASDTGEGVSSLLACSSILCESLNLGLSSSIYKWILLGSCHSLMAASTFPGREGTGQRYMGNTGDFWWRTLCRVKGTVEANCMED